MQPHDLPMRPIVIEIGLKEIYDQLVALNTKVEVLINAQADTDKTIADQEQRLRALERGRWPLPALTALMGVAALIFTALMYFNR